MLLRWSAPAVPVEPELVLLLVLPPGLEAVWAPLLPERLELLLEGRPAALDWLPEELEGSPEELDGLPEELDGMPDEEDEDEEELEELEELDDGMDGMLEEDCEVFVDSQATNSTEQALNMIRLFRAVFFMMTIPLTHSDTAFPVLLFLCCLLS